MELIALPAFEDNYLWLLHDGTQAVVVDPGDAPPVTEALRRLELRLTVILVTHHHSDHTGGVAALRDTTGAQVFGPARESIPEPFSPLHGGERIQALGIDWKVIDVPGHTAGHVAYFSNDVDGAPLLFCGDTLFSGGCGRIFEGTPAQMLASLDALAALPVDTRVCCAHEYTLNNLRFARAVEPDNAALADYQRQCQVLRNQGKPTLPTHLGQERAVNPFLRSRETSVSRSVQAHAACANDDVAVFAALRQWKNEFK
jgi:hydroxyacylglutathione hydrolase